MKILIKNKADIDFRNQVEISSKLQGGWTALLVASAYNHYECLKFLVESGADLTAENDVLAGV